MKTGVNLQDFWLSNDFLDILKTPKAQEKKEKTDKLALSKLKTCISKINELILIISIQI